MEDILKLARNFLKRMADADRRAADLEAEAGEIDWEMAFPLSAGVGRMEPGRAKGQHKSSVEAEAIKRELLRERVGDLLHEAGQIRQEYGYMAAFIDLLKRSPGFHDVGRVLECRYLQGLTVKETVDAMHYWWQADIKRLEEKGLMCVGAVFLGLVEPGAYYDHDGLFVMGAAEAEKILRKWR